MATQTEIERLAAAMHQLRPTWRVDSLVTFLTKHHSERAFSDLAVAAVIVTLDPKTQTPQLLNQHGPWWSAAYVGSGQGTEPVGPGNEPRCEKPGHEHELARHCRCCRAESLEAAS